MPSASRAMTSTKGTSQATIWGEAQPEGGRGRREGRERGREGGERKGEEGGKEEEGRKERRR